MISCHDMLFRVFVFLVICFFGYFEFWLFGFLVILIFGYLVIWCSGYFHFWLFGFLVFRFSKPTEYHSSERPVLKAKNISQYIYIYIYIHIDIHI